MYRLSTYIVRQILVWQVIALAGLTLAFLITQLLRVLPVFAGAGAGVLESATAIGLLLVPVATWSITPAFAIAVFSTAGRMGADGELTAVDACGLSRHRLALGPIALATVIFVISAWLWLDAAPRAQRHLRAIATDIAARALAGRLEPNRFISPMSGVTFFADARETDGSLRGVFLEDARETDRPVQFVASRAVLGLAPDHRTLAIRFDSGSAFYPTYSAGGQPAALSFDRLEIEIPFAEELEQRLDFLPALLAVSTPRLLGKAPPGVSPNEWSYALWRRVAGPFGFLSLSLLAGFLAFGVTWRRCGLAVAFAAALFLLYHLLCRLGESLMYSQLIGALEAAALPVVLVVLAIVVLFVVFGAAAAKSESNVRH